MRAVQDPPPERAESVGKEKGSTSLRVLPQHLIVAYYTLRFMKSRDGKTRILYTLNYFRAIQKRLAIDLREFGSRDRIDTQLSNPFVQSKEANQQVLNQANFSAKAYE